VRLRYRLSIEAHGIPAEGCYARTASFEEKRGYPSMTTNNDAPDKPTAPTPVDTSIRKRGRTGLVIPWERIPWWGIIILIVGVIVGFSIFSNARYIDAIYFIFDLPWNKNAIGSTEIDSSGQWTITSRISFEPGEYTINAVYFNASDDVIDRTEDYLITIPEIIDDTEAPPIALSDQLEITASSSKPTFSGSGPMDAEAILYDDFSSNPLRIAARVFMANGVFLTIRVTLAAFVGALVIGLLFGLMRVSSRSPNLFHGAHWRLLIGLPIVALTWFLFPDLRSWSSILIAAVAIESFMFLVPAMPYTLSTLYVELVRGIPMLVIVLYMGFAVTPALRNASRGWFTGEIDLRGLPAAVIGLAFGYGAYLAEIYRAGIESIHKGQMEAARSLGMSYFQAMRHVILPQAIRVVLPPLGNDFIAMLKDSSLISVIALPEILQQGRLWISRNFRAFEGFNSVALLYLVMTLGLSLFVGMIERRTSIE
jgi:ABC-type amino acid transport system permease subunit